VRPRLAKMRGLLPTAGHCLQRALLTARLASDRHRQGAHQIAIKLVGIFETGGKPEQIAGAGRTFTFDGGAMLDEAFDAAERCRALP
jgi:hypothetical protein